MLSLFRAPPRERGPRRSLGLGSRLRGNARSWGLAAILLLAFAPPALAAPTFPELTGRVVDDANLLSLATEQQLTQKLETLERQTGRQLVVATLPSLQGYEIEDYGYQLGRAWGIGTADKDDGAILIVAPNERKVRIEVGYGLEPVLTDALSSVIIQSAIIPKFREGDMEGGVVAGTEVILRQLTLPEDEARAIVAEAGEQADGRGGARLPFVILLVVLWVVFGLLSAGRRRSGLGGVVTGAVLGSILSGRGGGGGFGGGGFSGGGGSFGGGGASGGW